MNLPREPKARIYSISPLQQLQQGAFPPWESPLLLTLCFFSRWRVVFFPAGAQETLLFHPSSLTQQCADPFCRHWEAADPPCARKIESKPCCAVFAWGQERGGCKAPSLQGWKGRDLEAAVCDKGKCHRGASGGRGGIACVSSELPAGLKISPAALPRMLIFPEKAGAGKRWRIKSPAHQHCKELDGATSRGMHKEMLALGSLQGWVQGWYNYPPTRTSQHPVRSRPSPSHNFKVNTHTCKPSEPINASLSSAVMLLSKNICNISERSEEVNPSVKLLAWFRKTGVHQRKLELPLKWRR